MTDHDRLATLIFSILGPSGICCDIMGGYAGAQYGLTRPIKDLDLTVSDSPYARVLLLARGFTETDNYATLAHPDFPGLTVDVINAGSKIIRNTETNIWPRTCSSTPKFVSLFDLIWHKLGAAGAPQVAQDQRDKQRADIAQLIKANALAMEKVTPGSGFAYIGNMPVKQVDSLTQRVTTSTDPAKEMAVLKHVAGDTFRYQRDDGTLGAEAVFQRDAAGRVSGVRVWGQTSPRLGN